MAKKNLTQDKVNAAADFEASFEAESVGVESENTENTEGAKVTAEDAEIAKSTDDAVQNADITESRKELENFVAFDMRDLAYNVYTMKVSRNKFLIVSAALLAALWLVFGLTTATVWLVIAIILSVLFVFIGVMVFVGAKTVPFESERKKRDLKNLFLDADDLVLYERDILDADAADDKKGKLPKRYSVHYHSVDIEPEEGEEPYDEYTQYCFSEEAMAHYNDIGKLRIMYSPSWHKWYFVK